MVSTAINQFKPDFAVSPGEILAEELESRGMSQIELAERTGLAKKTINEIVNAKASITPESALKFQRVFRQPAPYWVNLETNFQEAIVRSKEKVKLQKDSAWLKKLPIAQMIDFGWVERYANKADQMDAVLSFFGLASIDQWESVWSDIAVSYRKSYAFEGAAESLSAWLRKGELESEQISCSPYSATSFKQVLTDVRALTNDSDPAVFIPTLRNLCAECGVAVVFVPELKKSHVSGATRWISKDKALIQLSLRFGSDDHLWFTFFHEAGHILKHGKKEIFLEKDEMPEDDQEKEADAFAGNFLIPRKEFRAFVTKGNFSKAAVCQFAEGLNIAPGIVVGQLQHKKWIEYSNLNGLKVRFKWNHNR